MIRKFDFYPSFTNAKDQKELVRTEKLHRVSPITGEAHCGIRQTLDKKNNPKSMSYKEAVESGIVCINCLKSTPAWTR